VVALETEDFVMGALLIVGGLAITIAALLSGAHWWFVLPGLALAAVIKGYGWSTSLDEDKLAEVPETLERPAMGGRHVLLRALPMLFVWFGLDVGLLLGNPDVAGAAGGGVSLGIGLAWLLNGRALAHYGRRHSVVIVSNAPRLYGVWRRSNTLMRARRAM
jgi:hypothetical protein